MRQLVRDEGEGGGCSIEASLQEDGCLRHQHLVTYFWKFNNGRLQQNICCTIIRLAEYYHKKKRTKWNSFPLSFSPF